MDFQRLQEDLYPQIFLHAETLFPEFLFRRTAKGYIASAGTSFDGSQGKAQGKINYLETSPAVLFDNRAGKTRNVIKYIQEREHIPTFIEAIKYCAQSVNFPLPNEAFTLSANGDNNGEREFSTTLEQEYQKRQAFEEVQRLFEEHLWASEIRSVENTIENRALHYLRQRGYSDDDIRSMHCGFALPFSKVHKYLRSLGYDDEIVQAMGLQSSVPDRSESHRWHTIGETYCISFPIRDAVGRMQGFIIRAVEVNKDAEGKDRFPKYLFTKNLSKAVPVGFNHTLSNAHVIAVEGIVDALFLQARGLKNVIAVGGKHLTDEQIRTLERYAVRSITLVFDNDSEGKRGTIETIEKLRRFAANDQFVNEKHNEKHNEKRKNSIQHHAQWNIYTLPAEAMLGAKDPDEFVRRHGIELFRQALEHKVESAEALLARSIAQEAQILFGTEYSPKQRDIALERAWGYLRYLRSPLDKHTFLQALSLETGINAEVLNATGAFATNFYHQEQERFSTQRVLSEAQTLLREGQDLDYINSLLQRHISAVRLTTPSFSTYSLQTFLQEISAAPDGLRTGYAELDDTMRLSQNGISIIAARPSHGKTSFKMNLLLNLIELYPERTFCFFSFEEPVKIITLKLLNILAGVRFQGQQIPDLISYLRHQYQTNSQFNSQSARIDLIEAAKEKLGQYLSSGRLRIIGEKISPDGIRTMIQNLQQIQNVGGVFVDYIQKVKPASGKFATRQLELQDVSASLHSIAVDMNVPMIVGAQFNREVRTESDVREDCLREAGDLEQDANLVLALWNPAKTNNDDAPQASSIQAQLGAIDTRRVDLKVKILKNRDGAVNLQGISLRYDMPLSTIHSLRTA